MKLLSKLTTLLAVVLSLAAGVHATPVQVTFDGVVYDVTDENLSFNGSASLLESQVWFGNESIAQTFALAVGTQLGLQSYAPPPSQLASQWGPLFAYDGTPDVWSYDGGGYQPTTFAGYGDYTFTYAVATAEPTSSVPDGGATITMLGMAVAGLAWFRRKGR